MITSLLTNKEKQTKHFQIVYFHDSTYIIKYRVKLSKQYFLYDSHIRLMAKKTIYRNHFILKLYTNSLRIFYFFKLNKLTVFTKYLQRIYFVFCRMFFGLEHLFIFFTTIIVLVLFSTVQYCHLVISTGAKYSWFLIK